MLEDKGTDFLERGLILDDIRFVQGEDDLLAPGQDALEELSLALREGMVGGGGEQDQVAARHEFIGQALVMADDCIRPGRIDNVQFLEKRQGISIDGKVFIHRLLGDLFAPLHQRDARGGRCRAFEQHLFPQQRVDEGALARIELPHDDDQEQFVQLQDGVLQGRQRLARQVDICQRDPHLRQGFLFLAQEPGLFVGKHGLAHQTSSTFSCHGFHGCSRKGI
jgi:hypothetical protein